MRIFVVTLLASVLLTLPIAASDFSDGPVIKGFGKHAVVQQSHAVNQHAEFKIVFDVAKQTGDGEVNRNFNSLARFINMHVANGVKPENINLALVVHGKAGFDLLNNNQYQKRFGKDNPNAKLIELLQKANTKVFLCGQSAAYYQIGSDDLLSGVEMSLSAMTANALLQQQGYTLNPF